MCNDLAKAMKGLDGKKVSSLHLFGPCATCPLAPLSDLLPLAVTLWGLLLAFSWSCPSRTCFCFLGRAFLALCLFFGLFGSSLAVAPLCRFFLFVFLQLLCWSLPLGIWLLHATARLPCLMLGVLWCFVSSLHLASWQQRPLALCGVLCFSLHHGACVSVVLLR